MCIHTFTILCNVLLNIPVNIWNPSFFIPICTKVWLITTINTYAVNNICTLPVTAQSTLIGSVPIYFFLFWASAIVLIIQSISSLLVHLSITITSFPYPFSEMVQLLVCHNCLLWCLHVSHYCNHCLYCGHFMNNIQTATWALWTASGFLILLIILSQSHNTSLSPLGSMSRILEIIPSILLFWDLACIEGWFFNSSFISWCFLRQC